MCYLKNTVKKRELVFLSDTSALQEVTLITNGNYSCKAYSLISQYTDIHK